MHDACHVFRGIASAGQEQGQIPQVGNRFNVSGALLFAKGAVQVCPNGHMAGIPSQLANMVHVVDHLFQVACHAFRG